MEQLEQWVRGLSGEEPVEPVVVEEQLARLLMSTVRLLKHHEVNGRGQCRFCGWTRWKRRIWHRRPRCTVFQAVDRATSEGLDVVWWELFAACGREVGLGEVREWVEGR